MRAAGNATIAFRRDLLQTWSPPVDLNASAQFGSSVATDGYKTIVGVPFADDANFNDVGQARIYDNQTGALVATLQNPSPGTFDLHGFSVAIANGIAAVSTYRDDALAPDSGSVSLYDANSGALLRTIHHPSPIGNEQFGFAIDLTPGTSSRLVVGARLDNAGTPGGKVFVFDTDSGNLLHTIENPSNAIGDFFGISVATSQDGRVLVGAPTNDTGGSNSGIAYLFDHEGALLETIQNPNPATNARFGEAVDIADSVVVGAFNHANGRGAAYVFNSSGGYEYTILGPNGVTNTQFARTVSINQEYVAIGNSYDNTGAPGAGIVYLYALADGTLSETITNPSPGFSDSFGISISLATQGLAVGASLDDGLYIDGGSAYLYRTQNLPPVGANDTASTNEDTPVSVNVLANDSDPDGDALSIDPNSVQIMSVFDSQSLQIPIVTASVSVQGEEILFNPGDDFQFLHPSMSATIQIGYIVKDAYGLQAPGELLISLTGVNDSPNAANVNVVTQRNAPVPITILASDAEASPPAGFVPWSLTVTAPSLTTAGGIITGLYPNLTYTPPLDYVGSDSFLYNVSDGQFSVSGQVNLTIESGNSPPTDIDPSEFEVLETTREIHSLGLLTATDPDSGETLTWSILPGLDSALFSIGGSGNNELIFDSRTIDYETNNLYQVEVQVVDSLSQSYSEVIHVHIVDRVEPVQIVLTTPDLSSELISVEELTIAVAFTGPVANAELAANYRLRFAGDDGDLDTADDILITPSSVAGTPLTAQLTYSGLQSGLHRFEILDSIEDLSGNPIDGDYDENSGGIWSQEFENLPTQANIAGFDVTGLNYLSASEVEGSVDLPFLGTLSLAGNFSQGAFEFTTDLSDVEFAGYNVSALQLTLNDSVGLELSQTIDLPLIGETILSGTLYANGDFTLTATAGPIALLDGLIEIDEVSLTFENTGLAWSSVASVAGLGDMSFEGYLDNSGNYDLSSQIDVSIAGFNLSDLVLNIGEEALGAEFSFDFPVLGSVNMVGEYSLTEGWAFSTPVPALSVAGFDLLSAVTEFTEDGLAINTTIDLPLLGDVAFSGTIEPNGTFSITAEIPNVSLLSGLIEFQDPTVTLTTDRITLSTTAEIAGIGTVDFDGYFSADGSYSLTADADVTIAGFSIDGVEFTIGNDSLGVQFEYDVDPLGTISFTGSYSGNGAWELGGTYPGPVIVGPVVFSDIEVLFASDRISATAEASVADLDAFVNAETTITVFSDGRFESSIDVDVLELAGFSLGNATVSFGNNHPGREYILDIAADLAIPYGPSISLSGKIREGGDYAFSYNQNVSFFGLTFSNAQITLSDEEGLQIDARWNHLYWEATVSGSISPAGRVEINGSGKGKIGSFTLGQITVDADLNPALEQFSIAVGASLRIPIPNTKKPMVVSVGGNYTASTPSWSELTLSGSSLLPKELTGLFPAAVNITVSSQALTFNGGIQLPFGMTAPANFSGTITSKGVITVNGEVNIPVLGSASVSGSLNTKGEFALTGKLNSSVSLGGFDNLIAADAAVTLTNKSVKLNALANLPVVGDIKIDAAMTFGKNGDYSIQASLVKGLKLPGMKSDTTLGNAVVTLSKSGSKLSAKLAGTATLLELGDATISGEISSDGNYEFAAKLKSDFKIAGVSAGSFDAKAVLKKDGTTSGIYVTGSVSLPIGKATFAGYISSKSYSIAATLDAKTLKIGGLHYKQFSSLSLTLTNKGASFSASVALPAKLGAATISGNVAKDNFELQAELSSSPAALGGFVSAGVSVKLTNSSIKVAVTMTLPNPIGKIAMSGTLSTTNELNLSRSLDGERALGGFAKSIIPELDVELTVNNKGDAKIALNGKIKAWFIGSSSFSGTLKSDGSYSLTVDAGSRLSIGGFGVSGTFKLKSSGGIEFKGSITLFGSTYSISGRINTNNTIDVSTFPGQQFPDLTDPKTYARIWHNITGDLDKVTGGLIKKLSNNNSFVARTLNDIGVGPDDVVNLFRRQQFSWGPIANAISGLPNMNINEVANIFKRQGGAAELKDVASALKLAFPNDSADALKNALKNAFPESAGEVTKAIGQALGKLGSLGEGVKLPSCCSVSFGNGIIVGSTLYFDANRNLTWDVGEPWEIADLNGDVLGEVPIEFDLNANGVIDADEGYWIVEGGVQLATDRPAINRLIAPADANTITPLTTLATLLSQNEAMPYEMAQSKVLAAMGLPASLDTRNFDPFAAVAANDPLGARVLQSHELIQSSIAQIVSLFEAPSADSPSSATTTRIADALVTQINAAQSPIDFNDSNVLAGWIASSSQRIGTPLSQPLIEAASQIIATGNSAVLAVDTTNHAASVAELYRVKTLIQSDIVADLNAAASGIRSIEMVLNANTGAAFDSQLASTRLTPFLSVPLDFFLSATSLSAMAVPFEVVARDYLGNPLPVQLSHAPGSFFPIGVTVVTAMAMDGFGNTVQDSFTVTVRDDEAPVLNVADVTLEAVDASGAPFSVSATAVDQIDDSPSITFAGVPSVFPIGITTITAVATDNFGNQSTRTFNVTVVDTTGPQITVPQNMTVILPAGSDAVSVEFGEAVAMDSVDSEVFVFQAESPQFFGPGVHVIEIRAEDQSGNETLASFTITVLDTIAPTIDVEDYLVIEAETSDGASIGAIPISVTDLGDANVAVEFTPSFLPFGVSTVVVTATDAQGNTAQATFTVEVVDTTPPDLSQLTEVTLEANAVGGAAYTLPTSVTDNTDPHPLLTYSSNPSFFELGATVIEVTATDASGNEAGQFVSILVVDTTAPSISIVNDIVVFATSSAGASVAFPVITVTDVADADPAVTFSHEAGSFPIGTTRVAIVATDASGNQFIREFAVVVLEDAQDEAAVPVIAAITGEPIEGNVIQLSGYALDSATGDPLPTATLSWAITDLGSGAVVTVSSGTTPGMASFIPEDNGTYRIALTAETLAGESFVTETMLVIENRAPVFDLVVTPSHASGNLILELNVNASDSGLIDQQAGFTYDWEITDANGNTFAVSSAESQLSFPVASEGIYEIRVTVTDKDGDAEFVTQSIGLTAPVAFDAEWTTSEDEILFESLIAEDGDQDALVYELVSPPEHGHVQVDADGRFLYEPNDHFNGMDAFSYRVFDGLLYSNTQTVTLTVQAVNDEPTALPATIELQEDTAFQGQLSAADIEGDSLTYGLVQGPEHGQLSLLEDGSYTYVPNENFTGLDSFLYEVTDGQDSSELVTVEIHVLPVDDLPLPFDIGIQGTEDAMVQGIFLFEDFDGGPATIQLGTLPQFGSVVLQANGTFEYTPNANFAGEDFFTFRTVRGSESSADATVFVTIDAANDAPINLELSSSTVFENVSVGTVVATLSVQDADNDEVHRYVLMEGDREVLSGPLAVVGNELRFQISPNFETQSQYPITIRAIDRAGAYIDRSFVITVLDVPEFPSLSYSLGTTVSLNEGSTFSRTITINDPGASDWSGSTINYGDGSGVQTLAVDSQGAFVLNRTYSDNGTYAISVNLVNNLGQSLTKSLDVNVFNVAPMAAFSVVGATYGDAANVALGQP